MRELYAHNENCSPRSEALEFLNDQQEHSLAQDHRFWAELPMEEQHEVIDKGGKEKYHDGNELLYCA
jgi:hypothetical protein